jgi:TRAP-type C4-dicarboxylate transport system permease small subunit
MAYLRFMDKVNRVLTPIGMGALMIMVVVVTLNILGRATINAPVYGTAEIVELTQCIMASLILAYTQFLKQNIIVSIVVDRMSLRLRGGFDCFALLLSTIFIALVTWTSTNYALQIPSETTNVFQITRFPFRLIFSFGSVVLFFVLAGQFAESLVKVVKR